MSGVRSSMMEFQGNGDQVPGYLARPDGVGPFPGVVVIQEWWGLNDHIKNVAGRFAGEGFVALAPDLYRGEIALEPDEARKLAMELEQDRAIRDIQGAVDALLALPYTSPKKVGVVGFCMGGGLSLGMAVQGRDVGAVTVFYGGRGRLDADTAARVSSPILGIFGEEDAGFPEDVVRGNEQMLRAAGKIAEYYIYPGAPHAFFNDTRAAYHPEAARDAWSKTLSWFRQYLV